MPLPQFDGYSSVPSSTVPSPLATPQIAGRTRASSTPPSPSSPSATGHSSTIQCHGTTKAGKRCNRVVKAPPLVSFFAPASDEPVERFCFQHVKEIIGQSGFYSHKQGSGWIKFADWIPEYLHLDTQAALRVEMEKPSSSKDEPGYIYAYEIRDDRMPDAVKIKVGRAVKLVKRLDQWSKQCTSKEVILRGWWPGTVEDDGDTTGTSLLRGRIKAGEKGPLCHRLERLVHLELADLAVHAPYLEPGFPEGGPKADASLAVSPIPGRSPKPSKVRMPLGKPCMDCGAMHKEIFTFQRVRDGKYKDAEWERLVQPVIAKWGRFVAGFV
ncbi:hypothetical protein K439DRAFT_1329947 [Ramaria rubella]|nr:hypothetical protein K439DRAFT_1329947 [Ramaria rubella]